MINYNSKVMLEVAQSNQKKDYVLIGCLILLFIVSML
jgi:hypothetical protein